MIWIASLFKSTATKGDETDPGVPSVGIFTLFEDPEVSLDILLVHGFRGDYKRSWTAKNNAFWPRDFLPHDVPHLRVLSYGYDSDAPNSRYLVHSMIHRQGKRLLDALVPLREKGGAIRRPIIFIGHGLGGIIIKSALTFANAAEDGGPPWRPILLSTAGVLFLGTPHRGTANDTWSESLKRIVSASQPMRNRDFFNHLDEELAWLETQLREFDTLSQGIHMASCFETRSSGPGRSLIVPEASASLGPNPHFENIGLDSSHSDMTRFTSINDHGYRVILEMVMKLQLHGIRDVGQRWLDFEDKQERSQIRQYRGRIRSDFRIRDREPFPDRNTPERFVGRHLELKRLEELLLDRAKEKSMNPVVIIEGPGGIGKTFLVREFLSRRQVYFSAILWVEATSHYTIEESFMDFMTQILCHYRKMTSESKHKDEILQELGMEGLVDEDWKLRREGIIRSLVVAAVKEWFGRDGNDEWLLIFDNLDRTTDFSIADFLPGKLTGHIILIGRHITYSGPQKLLRLGPMDRAESLLLLSMTAGIDLMDREEFEQATQTLEDLQFLPLAICRLGSFIATTGKALRDVAKALHESQIETTATGTDNVASRYLGALRMTLEASLSTVNDDAFVLLSICSFLDPDTIPFSLLDLYPWANPDFRKNARILAQHSLIIYDATEDCISVHRHVLNMVHDRLSTQEQKRVAFSTLRMILRAIGFSDMDQIGVENNQDQGGGKLDGHKLDSHLSAYLALVKDLWEEGLPPEIPSKAFIFLGSFSDDHGRLSDAEYCLKMALRKEPHSVFESCSASFGLGSLLNRERRYEDAEQILWGGFGFVHDDKLWAEDENQDLRENLMLTFYVNMARSLLGQGRSTEAENFASNGLKRCTEHFGPDHSRTFEVLETLGTMYEANQDYDRAEAMRRQQLTAFSSRLDNNDLILLHTRRKLVKVCVLKGNFTEAETLLRGTLRVVERRLGTTHPDHSTVMRALARLCDLQGRHDEAEEMFRRVLDAREGLLGKEHPDTLLVLHDLARCFFGQARYVEAEEIYRRVLSSIQIVLGKEHRETLWVEENLARCLNKAGNRDEAEMLLQKVRQSRAKTSAKGLDLPRSFA